ncbi:MAG: ACT domain-containing protein [Kiritimatiellae bacterium]|nr:ACT domain-containing protein [Kiritimatiellia bacterium]
MSTTSTNVQTATQISVFVDNRPGSLAEVAAELGARGVNILALSLAEGLDHGYVRVVVDQPEVATAVLAERRHMFFTREVRLVELEHRPGRLGELLGEWGRAGLNVEYCYTGATPEGRPLVVVKVEPPARTPAG